MLPSLLNARARASEASYFRKGEQLGTHELRKSISKEELEKLRQENRSLEEKIRSGEFQGLPEILQNVWIPSWKPENNVHTIERPLQVPLKRENRFSVKKEQALPTSELSSSARFAADSYYDLTRGRYEYLKKWRDTQEIGKTETLLSLSQKLRVEALGIGFRALLISTACTGALGCAIFLYLRPEDRRLKLRERTQRFSEHLRNWLKTPLSYISNRASSLLKGVTEDSSVKRVVDAVLEVDGETPKRNK